MKRPDPARQAGDAADSAAYPPASRAWLSAIIIFALTAIGLADRMAIAILIGPIKQDFGVGDFQASLLIGLACIVNRRAKLTLDRRPILTPLWWF